MTVDFVPSQVSIRGAFLGTFDRVETELTAALIVKTLADNGDVWRSANLYELKESFLKLTEPKGPWRDWFNNPFITIDMHGLVDRGYAKWDGETGISFTEKGLERMRELIPEDRKPK